MPTTHRFRPLLAVLVLAALLLAPWPAEATPRHPIDSFTGWLADLWAHVGLSWDPDGLAGSDSVSTPTEGLILDPDGGAASTGTNPSGTDVGLILDPDGRQ